MRASEAIS